MTLAKNTCRIDSSVELLGHGCHRGGGGFSSSGVEVGADPFGGFGNVLLESFDLPSLLLAFRKSHQRQLTEWRMLDTLHSHSSNQNSGECGFLCLHHAATGLN